MIPAWIGDPVLFAVSASAAFVTSSVIVALDCWRQNSEEFLYSTYPVFRDPFGILFCVTFGLLSAAAFAYVQYDPRSWLSEAMTLNIDNPIVRGAMTGLSVMVLVRSKILQMSKDAGDFGAEFAYLRGREIILRRLRQRQANAKNTFIRDHLAKIIRIDDFPEALDRHFKELLRGETKRLAAYEKQRGASEKPARPFVPDDTLWRTYYVVLTRDAADFVGISALKDWMESQVK